MKGKKVYSLILILILAAFMISLSRAQVSYAAARFSGTVISYDPSSGTYVIQLSDGSKKSIRMKQGGSVQKSGGTGFSTGEYAVFSIVSALNDDPLIADSVMDASNSKKTASQAYTIPSKTRVGGFPTTGGPAATGGTSPSNTLASVANSGGNLNPPNNVNAPFTASPSPSGSPYTGQVITGNGTGANNSANGYVDMFSGQNSSMITPSPNNNPYSGQALTTQSGVAPQSNPGAMITGEQNFDAYPSNMITGQSKKNNQDPFTSGMMNQCNPANMMMESQDEDDDENVSMFGDPSGGGNYAPCQINARVMDIKPANNVIFYMELGAQNIGSVVVTPTTQIVNGLTRQSMKLQSLPKGCVVVINGYQMGNYIQASNITMMKQK